MALFTHSRGGSWTSYSPAGTGWSSISTNYGLWTVIGRICTVTFQVGGTSNSTATTITLPLPASNFGDFAIRCRNNGLPFVSGLFECVGNTTPTTTVSCYRDLIGSNWTASGTKEVRGVIFFQI